MLTRTRVREDLRQLGLPIQDGDILRAEIGGTAPSVVNFRFRQPIRHNHDNIDLIDQEVQLDEVIGLDQSTTSTLNGNEKGISNSSESFCIDSSYKSRSMYVHFDDMENEDEWQLEVYLYVLAEMKRHKYKKIVDIGCGSGFKLIKYLGEFDTVGYELPCNLDRLRDRYPERTWKTSNFKSSEVVVADMIICSDVIEHLVNPNELLEFLKKQKFCILVISTPDRNLVYDKDDPHRHGPPRNIAHQREWNFTEFSNYIGRFFQIVEHKITNVEQSTQMIVCRN